MSNTHHNIEIQEEIARTYFHAPAKRQSRKKPKWRAIIPWAVAAFAVIFAAAILVFRSSVDIKVRFLGEVPAASFNNGAGQAGGVIDKGIYLIEGGAPNKDIVKNAYFTGDAKEYSISKPEELLLCNSRGSGWANYTIELRDPVDLDKLDLKYTAKGARGDEFLTLVIADSDRRSYRLERDLSSALAKDWQGYVINFGRVKKALDISNISAIKFEFGSLTAGNYPSAVMSLKDVYITKTRRLKWL